MPSRRSGSSEVSTAIAYVPFSLLPPVIRIIGTNRCRRFTLQAITAPLGGNPMSVAASISDLTRTLPDFREVPRGDIGFDVENDGEDRQFSSSPTQESRDRLRCGRAPRRQFRMSHRTLID